MFYLYLWLGGIIFFALSVSTGLYWFIAIWLIGLPIVAIIQRHKKNVAVKNFNELVKLELEEKRKNKADKNSK